MQDHSITLPGYATDNRHTYRELGRDMTGTLTQPLWEHMRQYHTEYSDENRVVSNDAFAEVIHTIDHDDERGEGVLIPHQHEHGPDGYFVTHPDATVEILEEGQDGARRGGAAGRYIVTARGDGAGGALRFDEGDVVRVKGDRSLYRITQTIDTNDGQGYWIMPALAGGGASKVIRDEVIAERIRTAAEEAAEREEAR